MSQNNWTPNQIEDFNLWKAWDEGGRTKRLLQPLMDRLDPLIATKIRPFQTVQMIPQSAIEAEFKVHAISALEKYDPNYGVPISHHVMRQMDGAKRFVYDYQNIGRIPSHRVRKIGEFKSAFSDLENNVGRPPTALELADKLRWPVSEVSRMTTELRSDLLPWKTESAAAALDVTIPRNKEILDLIPYDLSPTQQAVFEYTFGYGGKPVLGSNDIAKAIGVSPSRVSRLKSEIADKIKPYLEE